MSDSYNTSLLENFISNGSKCKYPAGLYLVATPIGNMEDITLRALSTLSKADIVACEDTRVTRKLLIHYGLSKPLMTYNDAKGDAGGQLHDALKNGNRIALVSDAGMPLVSDPGYKLVQYALANDIYVTCIPGASAALCALLLSGLPCESFTFSGFFPRKNQEARTCLSGLSPEHTYLFFESPKRLKATLEHLSSAQNIKDIAVARELTKAFEQVMRGTPQEILENLDQIPLKGELVLVLRTKPSVLSLENVDKLIRESLKESSVKSTVEDLQKIVDIPKKELYKRVLQIKEKE